MGLINYFHEFHCNLDLTLIILFSPSLTSYIHRDYSKWVVSFDVETLSPLDIKMWTSRFVRKVALYGFFPKLWSKHPCFLKLGLLFFPLTLVVNENSHISFTLLSLYLKNHRVSSILEMEVMKLFFGSFTSHHWNKLIDDPLWYLWFPCSLPISPFVLPKRIYSLSVSLIIIYFHNSELVLWLYLLWWL